MRTSIGRGCLPLVRRCLLIITIPALLQTFTRLANELGGIFYVRILHVPLVVIADPALWQHALSPGVDLPKAPTVYKTLDQASSHLFILFWPSLSGARNMLAAIKRAKPSSCMATRDICPVPLPLLRWPPLQSAALVFMPCR